MRYSAEHKQRTRERILTQAARLFRRDGYAGVGIESIMTSARLTRGGFYGHFRSKSALFAEVIRGEHDFTRRLGARTGQTREELLAGAMDVVGGYLDPDHRDRVGRGCTLAALSMDVARAGVPARRAYREAVDDLLAEFGRSLPGAPARDARSIASLALCIGGILMARGVDDDEVAREILAACRDGVEKTLSQSTPQATTGSNT